MYNQTMEDLLNEHYANDETGTKFTKEIKRYTG